MVSLDSAIGSPLTFDEVKRLVETSSPSIELKYDTGLDNGSCGKGRYLVAKRAIKRGEIILSEHPLFCGRTDGAHSKKICVEEFVSLSIGEEIADVAEDDDCLHPCSPLVDCLSAILIARSQALQSQDKTECAQAKLKLRQLATLHRTNVNMQFLSETVKEVLSVFRPEFRGLVTETEVQDIVRAVSSNRFSGMDSQLDLMFAGSMFEHSCMPNCFAANWRRATSQPRLYRALHEIQAGDALSISYIQLPELYSPTPARADLLSGWGFTCACPRCTHLPELARTFICPACSEPELCPPRPGCDVHELCCLKCGHSAEHDYVARCFQLEEILKRMSEGDETESLGGASQTNGDNDIISCFHHVAFRVAYEKMDEGLGDLIGRVLTTASAIEDVIQCITRLHSSETHPHLLELYHTMAELTCKDLVEQQHFLRLEHAVLASSYPDESQRQDDEILHMVTRRGPIEKGAPHAWNMPEEVELSGMD